MESIPMLNLNEVKEYLLNFCLVWGEKQTNIPVLWGEPAIGKSQIIKEIADENDAMVIEYFASTANETEVSGIPLHDEKEDVIRFRPLENMKFPKDKKVIWFWDEINRGRPEVIQALFSILSSYPRKVGTHVIPDNVYIILAGNFGEQDTTIVTDFNDNSFYSKLSHIGVQFSKPVFIQYLKSKYLDKKNQCSGFATNVIKFLSEKDDTFCHNLPDNPAAEKAFATPRAIEKLIVTFGSKDLTNVTVKWGASIVGNSWIQQFSSYVKDLVSGVQRITPAVFFDGKTSAIDIKNLVNDMDNAAYMNFGKEFLGYIKTVDSSMVKNNLSTEKWGLCAEAILKLPVDITKSIIQSLLDVDEIRQAFIDKSNSDAQFEKITQTITDKIVEEPGAK